MELEVRRHYQNRFPLLSALLGEGVASHRPPSSSEGIRRRDYSGPKGSRTVGGPRTSPSTKRPMG